MIYRNLKDRLESKLKISYQKSRRMCTSVSARIYDIPGFTAPLSLKLKYDLRELIKEDPSWDNPISSSLRAKWIENFKLIEELRDVLYVKCPIPEDALRPSVRIWILSDAWREESLSMHMLAVTDEMEAS